MVLRWIGKKNPNKRSCYRKSHQPPMHRLLQLVRHLIHLPNGYCQYYLRFESFRFSQLYSMPLEYTSKSQVFKSFIVYLLSFRLMNTQVCLFVWIDTILLFNLFVRLFGFWIDMTRLDSTRLESTRRSQMPIENRYVHFVRWDSLGNSQLRKTPLKRSNIWTSLKYMLRIWQDVSLG